MSNPPPDSSPPRSRSRAPSPSPSPSRGRSVLWALAFAAWALLIVLGGLHDTDGGSSYRFGAVLGRAFITLLVGWALHLAFLRLRGRRGHAWSPAAVAIAAVLALVLLLADVARSNQRADDDAAACAPGKRPSLEQSFGPLPPGLRYQPLAPEQERALEQAVQGEFRSRAAEVGGRLVVAGGERAGVVLSQISRVAVDPANVRRGFLRSARAPGRDVELGGHPATLVSAGQGYLALGSDGPCVVLTIFGEREERVREVGAAVLGDP